jgi:hypothetical protein
MQTIFQTSCSLRFSKRGNVLSAASEIQSIVGGHGKDRILILHLFPLYY